MPDRSTRRAATDQDIGDIDVFPICQLPRSFDGYKEWCRRLTERIEALDDATKVKMLITPRKSNSEMITDRDSFIDKTDLLTKDST